jgi:hypothetical protein
VAEEGRIANCAKTFVALGVGWLRGALGAHLNMRQLAQPFELSLLGFVHQLMTAAAGLFARRGVQYLYPGSCYSQNALYKIQFSGVQFFNGFAWSADLNELKFLLRRGQEAQASHLLEDPVFRQTFQLDIEEAVNQSDFRVR